MKIGELGAILHSRWTYGQNGCDIRGEWAEDNSPYTITVPEQLRDLIVEVQNALSDLYHRWYTSKDEVRHSFRKLEGIFPGLRED